jgi:general secretion pathway protein E
MPSGTRFCRCRSRRTRWWWPPPSRLSTDWVAEVERQSRRSVRRVVANPQDIHRFTAEFFALAKSVRAANKAGNNAGSSFEQLVELGKSNKQLDANDQSVVQVVDWLWQYAFDQRASDIHLEPRREQGVIRFRIDGVLHPVYQMPMGVLNAMTARIKLLGRMDVMEKAPPAGWPHQDPQPQW